MVRWNLDKYVKCHDEWSDLPYWKHLETDNVVWEEPTFDLLLPPGMAAKFPPDLPIDDPHGWEEVLTDQAMAQHGGDADIDYSSEEASETFTEYSDDLEPDASELDEPSLLTGDPAPPTPGETPLAGETPLGTDALGELVGPVDEDAEEVEEESESEESDDPDMLVWEEEEAVMPSTTDALAMMRLEHATLKDQDVINLRCDEARARVGKG